VDEQLKELAAYQWGMVTTAQAGARGVSRASLAQRAKDGSLERVRQGVYHLAGSPTSDLDGIYAAWLASEPRKPAWERADQPTVVVAESTAAKVHGIGDLDPVPYSFITAARKQSKQPDIRYVLRDVPRDDVVVVDGLPTTSVERTISDLLIAPGSDESIVADALGEAFAGPFDIDTSKLIGHLSVHAKRLGLSAGDGASLYRNLRAIAGIDNRHFNVTFENSNLDEVIARAVRSHVTHLLQNIKIPTPSIKIPNLALVAPTRAQLSHPFPRVDLSNAVARDIQEAVARSIPKLVARSPRRDVPQPSRTGFSAHFHIPESGIVDLDVPMPQLKPIDVAPIDFSFMDLIDEAETEAMRHGQRIMP